MCICDYPNEWYNGISLNNFDDLWLNIQSTAVLNNQFDNSVQCI